MKLLEKVKQEKENLLNDLIKLLQFNSVGIDQPEKKDAPYGEGVRDALLHMLKLGEEYGFKTKNVENVAGHIEYGEGDEIVGVLCHLDVVPAGDGWKYYPFSGTIDDGKIYARGALDDKGPTMSAFYALKILKDLNIKLRKKIRLILGTDEESGMRGVKRYLEVCPKPDLGFSPDANFPLIYGEKGIMSIDIISKEKDEKLISLNSGERYNVVPELAELKYSKDLSDKFNNFIEKYNYKGKIENNKYILLGESAHAMEPEKGINALINLCKFLNENHQNNLIKFIAEKVNDTRFKTLGLDFTNPEMGDLTVNVAFAKINNEGGKVGLNLRYPINWDQDRFLEQLSKVANEYGLEVKVKSNSKPHFVDKESNLVKTLHQAYIKYTGDNKSKLQTIGGGTYARSLGNAVAFGMLMPGREDVVHKVDEYIYINDLITSTAIFAEAIYQLGK